MKLKKVEIKDGRINYVCLMDQCPHSCCGPFGGVQRGIDSIEGRQFDEIFLNDEDVTRIISAGHSNFIGLNDRGGYSMKLHPDGTCRAFADGRCSIHQARPTLCRAYPFYIDMFVGLCITTTCPGIGQGWTPLNQLMPEIRSALEMYNFWFSEIHKLSKNGFIPERDK